MGVSQDLMEDGDISVPLLPDTPTSVLSAVDVRTYAYSQIIITPAHFASGDLSDADLLALSRFTGVYLGQSDRRLNLNGAGLTWWLGDESDNGFMFAGVDSNTSNLNLADQLDARIFTSFSNGLTRGSTNALATLRTLTRTGGSTPRQYLDTICAAYNSTPFEWRCNPDGSIDVDTQTVLFPTVTTPTVVLAQQGGRDSAITGLAADLDIDSIDVEDYRTEVQARWNEATPGTNNGVATNTPLSTWVDFAGAAPDLKTVIDFNPKKQFRERPHKSPRFNGAAYASWYVQALTQATNLATRHANQTNTYAIEATADINEFDPWRFVKVGDTVYVYDIDLGLINTANEVYYRGEAIHPQKLRVTSMTTPILEGYGVYLRRSNGAGGFLTPYDLTPYVDFEEGETTLSIGTTKRFRPSVARPKRFNKKRIRRNQRRQYQIRKYLEAVS